MITENHITLRTGMELEQSIAEHPFFSAIDKDAMAEIVRDAREVAFQTGDIIFHEHAPANSFYLITEGQVALESHVPEDGPLFVETIGPREVLGWSWLVPPFAWQFTARAVTPTRAIALNGAHLLCACEANPALGCALLKRVIAVILDRLQATRRRVLELAANQATR